MAQSDVCWILEQLSIEESQLLEISCMVYRTDVFWAGDEKIISRHIDLEYSYGEYMEINEETALFQDIFARCHLPLTQEEQEIIIYQK